MPKSNKRTPKTRAKRPVGNPRIDVFSMRRTATTSLIPIKDIQIPDWMVGTDPIFLSLYTKYLTGKLPAYATRVPIEQIQKGFYLTSQNMEYRCDSPPEIVIEEQMLDIRQGARRPLHLYSNPKPTEGRRFLCPDDVVLYIAYQRLGIASVPAMVFAPGEKPLPESSLEVRVMPSASSLGPRVCGLISTERPQRFPTILGASILPDDISGISKLMSELVSSVERLRQFHVAAPNQLHYHHMVFSAIVRAQETVRAINLLVSGNLWHQALALLRLLYEILLNFFFDWLQPETNYRFLAASAVLGSAGITKAKSRMSKGLMVEGVSQKAAEEQAKIAWKPVTIASTVAEKAKLPKVGITYHKDIYSFLSQVTHQDFEVASLHANRFDDEKFLTIDNDLKITFFRFMDLVVSEFVSCVDRDIGNLTVSKN